MRRLVERWAAAAVLLLGDLMAAGDPGAGEELQLHIVCFNFETVQVTWNASGLAGTNLTFFYTFEHGALPTPCTNYTFQQGRTTGCFLEAEDQILYFSIRNGSRLLLAMSQWMSDYLKPKSPKDVQFLWHSEGVSVTCSDLPYPGLLYEVQYRSSFDAEWQSKEERTCNVTLGGLDTHKCYSFRTRVKTTETMYGPQATPSDWSEVTHWKRAELRDSCQEERDPRRTQSPKLIVVCSAVTLLTVSLLLLSLWKLQRVKRLLVPRVPDPKGTFPGLFEQHQGNFQEWIRDTQNVVPPKKAEQDRHPEETLVVHLLKTEPEEPARTGPLCLRTGEEAAPGGAPRLPPQAPQGGAVVVLGGLAFVMNDDCYMML
ncbi:cytokine receptor-like factor 2 isoform X2 [Sciurus carolinensis]|uniref:cytokine receptor-like factor 2 isoform X2 n=1 Tax=Sciurus carolinensis TaxID=30640 RepID=UPI001FB1BDC0|nr:cytokine receptor-like factor 2 isoform X2 [Sciurus carolinensis]